jgi:hypothetical protein
MRHDNAIHPASHHHSALTRPVLLHRPSTTAPDPGERKKVRPSRTLGVPTSTRPPDLARSPSRSPLHAIAIALPLRKRDAQRECTYPLRPPPIKRARCPVPNRGPPPIQWARHPTHTCTTPTHSLPSNGRDAQSAIMALLSSNGRPHRSRRCPRTATGI